MIFDDYDGQIMFGESWGPKASWHLSYRLGKSPKKTHPGNLSRPGIELGAKSVIGSHATACCTAVDISYSFKSDYKSTKKIFYLRQPISIAKTRRNEMKKIE